MGRRAISRTEKPRVLPTQRGKVLPAKNRSRGPDVRTTLVQTCGPVSDKGGSEMPESGTDVRAISQDSTGPDVRAITSLTTPCPASALVSALSAVTDAAAVPDIPGDSCSPATATR